MELAMIEPMAIQMSFDYSEYSPELAASLEQHAANMEGFTKRYAAGMGKELDEAKAEIHAEKQTGWGKWVEGRLGITVQWADKIIKQYKNPKSETNFQISPPVESEAPVYGNFLNGEPIEDETIKFRYDGSHPAYCKYCYKTHQSWTLEEGEAWECGICEHRTRDEYMQIENIAPSKEQETFYCPPRNIDNIPLAVPHISSKNNEWYTPQKYVDAARKLMGGIDLDPASCKEANETVKAARYYDITQNGLDYPWKGLIWLNPPYGYTDGESNQALWSNRLIDQYTNGNIDEAVLLVNAAVDTSWFQRLFDYPICFTRGRINFTTPEPVANGSTHGSAFIYFGSQPDRFFEVFSEFGRVVKPWQ